MLRSVSAGSDDTPIVTNLTYGFGHAATAIAVSAEPIARKSLCRKRFAVPWDRVRLKMKLRI